MRFPTQVYVTENVTFWKHENVCVLIRTKLNSNPWKVNQYQKSSSPWAARQVSGISLLDIFKAQIHPVKLVIKSFQQINTQPNILRLRLCINTTVSTDRWAKSWIIPMLNHFFLKITIWFSDFYTLGKFHQNLFFFKIKMCGIFLNSQALNTGDREHTGTMHAKLWNFHVTHVL